MSKPSRPPVQPWLPPQPARRERERVIVIRERAGRRGGGAFLGGFILATLPWLAAAVLFALAGAYQGHASAAVPSWAQSVAVACAWLLLCMKWLELVAVVLGIVTLAQGAVVRGLLVLLIAGPSFAVGWLFWDATLGRIRWN